jgi:hypothetical protein
VPENPVVELDVQPVFREAGRLLRHAASSDLLEWADILNRLTLLCKSSVVLQLVLMQFGPIKHKARAGQIPGHHL